MDSRVQDERHWSCEGTTASVKEDYVVLEVLLVEREGFRVLSSNRDLYVYDNCPFWHWLAYCNSTYHSGQGVHKVELRCAC